MLQLPVCSINPISRTFLLIPPRRKRHKILSWFVSLILGIKQMSKSNRYNCLKWAPPVIRFTISVATRIGEIRRKVQQSGATSPAACSFVSILFSFHVFVSRTRNAFNTIKKEKKRTVSVSYSSIKKQKFCRKE